LNPIQEDTVSHFSRLWLRNYLIHLKIFFQNENRYLPSNNFFNSNCPIVFCGAAPSLEEDIDKIKKERDSFLLFSSDTSLGYLIKNNIFPDFIISIDPGRGTYYHLIQKFPETIPILTWLGCNRYIFELKNPKIILPTSYPLDQWILAKIYNSDDYIENKGMNVSTLILSLAERWKMSELYFSGVSFISQSTKTHCVGTGYEEYRIHNTNRFKTLDSFITKSYTKLSIKNQLALSVLQKNKYEFKSFRDYHPSKPAITNLETIKDNRKNIYEWVKAISEKEWIKYLENDSKNLYLNFDRYSKIFF
jgi:hypothetical protein